MFKRPGCRKPLSARALARPGSLPLREPGRRHRADGPLAPAPSRAAAPLGRTFSAPASLSVPGASRGSVRAGTRHKRQLQTRHLKAILKAGDHGL
jgi:hypothetical protein